MSGASISKEKVKSLTECHVYLLTSVCYFYFSPVIDKTHPIWFLFLTVRTVVIKENLHLKKQFKTYNNECVEREWKLIL